ncbi:response regulator [Photobacterium sp. SDRW27]|uniref:response regulator n=1 Tax=Photobacterium obscurum TaxID=2829490 RepID=UPI0022443A6B|nr:response regulator [Photobacterium obscurum]MCW8332059.1 response regulator [Photobacterium obscurum]
MSQTLFQRQFRLSYDNLTNIRHVLGEKAKVLHFSPELIQNIKLVCSEYCANLLEHQKTVSDSIVISYDKSGAESYLTIKDNGSPWTQLSQQLQAAELPENLVENGMGLALIRASFPDFEYKCTESGNQIRFCLPINKPRRQIVIVDDSASQLALLAKFLEEDYQLALFSQASEALLWLTNNHCDLVLTDLHMPEINGFNFRKQVASVPHHQLLPFVFLSGDTMTDTLSVAAQTGIDDFLAKPISKPHLLTVLNRVLKRHQHLISSFEARLQQQLTPHVLHTHIHPLRAPGELMINQQPKSCGDFVMQRQLSDGSQLIILGDQMGHGLVAKANGAVCFGFISGLLHNPAIIPEQLFSILNTQLYQSNDNGNLICLLALHLTTDHRLSVYNAGMPNPVFFGDTPHEIKPAMGLLGLFEAIEVSCWQTQLFSGSSVHCYSDGLVEGRWAEGELQQLQAMSPQLRHQHLWQRTPQSIEDDRSLISVIY